MTFTWFKNATERQLHVGTLIRIRGYSGTVRIARVSGGVYTEEYAGARQSIHPVTGDYNTPYANRDDLRFCNPHCPKETL